MEWIRARGPRGASLAVASLVVALILPFSGCSLSSSKSPDDRIVRKSTAPQPTISTSGKLSRDPAPLTLRDLSKYPANSAVGAVMHLFFWAQWGSYPNVVAAYDPRVRRAVGVPVIAGTYSQLRPGLLLTQPRVVEVTRTQLGTFVAVEQLTKSDPPTRDSYLLQRRGRTWQILHDTQLERGLAGFVQSQVQTDIDATATKPAKQAVKAGAQAADNFRGLFAPAGSRR